MIRNSFILAQREYAKHIAVSELSSAIYASEVEADILPAQRALDKLDLKSASDFLSAVLEVNKTEHLQSAFLPVDELNQALRASISREVNKLNYQRVSEIIESRNVSNSLNSIVTNSEVNDNKASGSVEHSKLQSQQKSSQDVKDMTGAIDVEIDDVIQRIRDRLVSTTSAAINN